MSKPTMLTTDNTVLVIIDIQEKLTRVIHNRENLVQNVLKLIKGMQVLEIPIILTEQYPAGLGLTLPEITRLIPDTKPLEKVCFSCCGIEPFREQLESLNRRQVLIIGIETHVCVYQTAMDLQDLGYEVHLVVDCISSRHPENKEVSLAKMSQAGINLTTTEMVLFELLKVAKGDKFKQISQIVK
jgi:nicotinamidase-related amidase